MCRPFSVSPQTASVDVGALLQLDVTYRPTCNNTHLSSLLVKYSAGLLNMYFILTALNLQHRVKWLSKWQKRTRHRFASSLEVPILLVTLLNIFFRLVKHLYINYS